MNTVLYRTDRTILLKKADKADKYRLKRLFCTKNQGNFLGGPGVGRQGKAVELLEVRKGTIQASAKRLQAAKTGV
jgi:hypothetical protein